MKPTVEPLPPVTVEFLRIVQGVDAVRLRCEGCEAVRITSWANLGLLDDAPFPPAGAAWKCGMCGGADIAVTPEWPIEAKRDGEVPAEAMIPSDPQNAVPENRGAISPALRDRLEAMMARLGKAEG